MTREKAKENLLREISNGLFEVEASDTVSLIDIEQYNLASDKDILNAMKKQKAKTCQTMLQRWIDSPTPKLQELAFRILADERNRVMMTGVATPMIDGEGADNELIIELVDSTSKIDTADADVEENEEEEEETKPKKRGRRKK